MVSLLLAGVVLLAISLQRTYASVPLKELKRRARHDDQAAALLYQAAAYGPSLRAVLWFLVGVSAGGFFAFTDRHVAAWLAVGLSSLLVWVGFVWLPSREVRRLSLWFAQTLAPALSWLLQYLHMPISRLASWLHKHWPLTIHTGLYDKQDLLDLINSQNVQADNRIEEHELELAYHALSFGDKLVSDYLTPRRIVKTVSVDDTTGPVLMAELHKSGFSRFPVYETKKDNIVGTLFLRNLVKTQTSAKVRDVMDKTVVYIHEDQTLPDALQAILKTHHHLLVVVNSFEEFVGVLAIEDVLGQLLGQAIIDEFDQYDDIRAVAQRAAHQEHQVHETAEIQASEPSTEVVE